MRSLTILLFVVFALICFMYEVRDTEGAPVSEGAPAEASVSSVLLESVLNQTFDGISTALKNGESIDVVNVNGWSAARFAVEFSGIDMVRRLIVLGINLNNADRNGVTPLMAAAQNVRISLQLMNNRYFYPSSLI
jgi:ankyrin repeat protein